MSARVLVVGLDGADWDILEPLLDAGRMPHLAKLLARGARGVLESTDPPVTFPAWNTFLTGVNPGRHGVLDFTRWQPGSYAVQFTPGGIRRVPSVLEQLDGVGLRVAALSFPGTSPPPRLTHGFVLSGFDAPVALGPDTSHAWPPEPYARLAERFGPWVYADVDELKVGHGWHETALARLLAGLSRKGDLAGTMLEGQAWDVFAVHLGETDTVGHHFMAFHDETSPRRPGRVPEVLADAVNQVYVAADRVIGRLVAAAGVGVEVLVASDHGMVAASDRVVHLNRALAEGGFTRFVAGAGRPSLPGLATSLALKGLPGRLKERVFRALQGSASTLESRRRLAGLDLPGSVAFSEELTYAPSVRLNVVDREPAGLIAAEEIDGVVEALTDHLLSLEDPHTGLPVLRRILPRARALHGPAVDEAPDLYLELAAPGGHPYTVLPSGGPGPWLTRLSGAARLGGKGRGPTGVHRKAGVVVLASETGPRGELGRVPIGAGAATILALAGVAPPPGLDYPGLVEVPSDAVAAPRSLEEDAVPHPGYGPDEEAVLAHRLQALGYL